MDYDKELDAIGLLCPLPVLKARKHLQSLETGQILRLLADDPAAVIDVPHYCQESGHELCTTVQNADHKAYYIRKAT